MKKLCMLVMLGSKLALGSSLEILEHRFYETKGMSTQKALWGFLVSEKEKALNTLLEDVTQAFAKEDEHLQDSIRALQSSLNTVRLNPNVLVLFIVCPILWIFLPILWPLFLIGASERVDRRYSQEQIRQQIEKIYELKQSRSARYSNLIINIKEELKDL